MTEDLPTGKETYAFGRAQVDFALRSEQLLELAVLSLAQTFPEVDDLNLEHLPRFLIANHNVDRLTNRERQRIFSQVHQDLPQSDLVAVQRAWQRHLLLVGLAEDSAGRYSKVVV